MKDSETVTTPTQFDFEALPHEVALTLHRTLQRMGISEPTPIQAKTLPLGFEGKDVLGCAQTGTGKTLAFSLPLLTHVLGVRKRISLVLTPTRELALQVQLVMRELSRDFSQLRSVALIGGESMFPQVKKLKARPRPQIIVATPGRLLDHIEHGTVRPDLVDFLVLDEADRMLDMGFEPQLKAIAKEMPKERQTLLFSATLSDKIKDIASAYTQEPVEITVGPRAKPVLAITQKILQVSPRSKATALLEQVEERKGATIIFAAAKHRVDRIATTLRRKGHEVAHIHGGRTQGQRKRALEAFQKGDVRILVATDVAARGLHVSEVMHVINFDPPREGEDYVHRIGRTGRAGAKGEALTFVSPEDRNHWNNIAKEYCKDLVIAGGKDKKDKEPRGPKKKKLDKKRATSRKPRRDEEPRGRFAKKKTSARKPRFEKDENRKPRFSKAKAGRRTRDFEDDDRKPRFTKSKTTRKPRFEKDDDRKPRFAKSKTTRKPRFEKDEDRKPRFSKSKTARKPRFEKDDDRKPRFAKSKTARKPRFDRDEAPRDGGFKKKFSKKKSPSRGKFKPPKGSVRGRGLGALKVKRKSSRLGARPAQHA